MTAEGNKKLINDAIILIHLSNGKVVAYNLHLLEVFARAALRMEATSVGLNAKIAFATALAAISDKGATTMMDKVIPFNEYSTTYAYDQEVAYT